MSGTPTIIFVHGILSSSEVCFPEMQKSIADDSRFSAWARYAFDYDYHNSIEDSARELADLVILETPDAPVYLVGHSMGGLVARMAILSGRVPNVRKLIMLGTPNFGACRTSRSAILTQAALLTAGHVSSVFRKPGILELTRVTKVMAKSIAEGERHADDVDYATIAGTYFNESRGILDAGSRRQGAMGAAFTALRVLVELSSLVPLWHPAIDRPHDGIVEQQSCAMVPTGAGRRSEKTPSINDRARFGDTYVHIFDHTCDDLMHVTIQSNSTVIDIVKSILLAASLPAWRQSLHRDVARRLKVEPA